MSHSSILISLVEPCSLLIRAFRDYTATLLQRNSAKVVDMTHALNYNFAPFMQQLLKEIFEDTPRVNGLGQVPESTKILMRDGLEYNFATALANDVLRATIACIVPYVPEARFGPNHEYSFDLCSPMDLMVTHHPQLAYEED